MSFLDSNAFAVQVQDPVITGGLPLWLSGAAVFEWVQLDKTSMSFMDLTPLTPIINGNGSAIMLDKDAQGVGIPGRNYGHPIQTDGIMAQGGGTLRVADSDLLLFGGGGAGAWAGNDIRGLRLEDDVPVWTVRKPPSPDYWTAHYSAPKGTSHAWMQDYLSPNSRHSYNGPQYCNGNDEFMVFGCGPVWETDSYPASGAGVDGSSSVVDGLDWATKTWKGSRFHPDVPSILSAAWISPWIAKHPVTEIFYVPSWQYIHKYDPFANGGAGAWTFGVFPSGPTDSDRAAGCIDPDHNLILTIGYGTGSVGQRGNAVRVYRLGATPLVRILGTLTGTFAANIYNPATTWSSNMVWCPDLHCFLWYQDDAFVYTITQGANDATWIVDRLSLSGQGPPASVTKSDGGGSGFPQVYGRMQYVPNLKGVVMQLNCEINAFFFRTG